MGGVSSVDGQFGDVARFIGEAKDAKVCPQHNFKQYFLTHSD